MRWVYAKNVRNKSTKISFAPFDFLKRKLDMNPVAKEFPKYEYRFGNGFYGNLHIGSVKTKQWRQ